MVRKWCVFTVVEIPNLLLYMAFNALLFVKYCNSKKHITMLSLLEVQCPINVKRHAYRCISLIVLLLST